MSRKKKQPKTAKNNPKAKLLNNHIYRVGKNNNRKRKKIEAKINANERLSSIRETTKAKKMIKIENYAKENKISITKAMIHFMTSK